MADAVISVYCLLPLLLVSQVLFRGVAISVHILWVDLNLLYLFIYTSCALMPELPHRAGLLRRLCSPPVREHIEHDQVPVTGSGSASVRVPYFSACAAGWAS